MKETEVEKVIEEISKREGRIIRFVQAAKKTVSVRSLLSSESLPTDISYDRNKKKAYSITDTDKEECQKRKMEDKDRHTREKQN